MKKAIVTGASSGIGYQTAKMLAVDYGYEVVAISRNKEKLECLKEEVIRQRGASKLHVLPFDLAEGDYLNLEASILQLMGGRLDVLINNAGAIVNKPFEALSKEDFFRVYEVNVFSVVQLIQLCHPLLKNSKGHVVNISSMGGYQGSAKFPGLSAYSSSKAAVACLSECLAEEYKEDGIVVNALCLGAVQTEMLEKAFPDYQAPVTAEEMGKYIANFCHTSPTVMNGKVISVSMSNP